MRRPASALLLCSALLTLVGCKNPCRELSERFCDCVDQYLRSDCLLRVSQREQSAEPDDAALEVCEQRLQTCKIDPKDRTTCDLQTEEDKVNCGLAR